MKTLENNCRVDFYDPERPFKIGDYVRKKSGSRWEGVVVTCYKSWTTRTWHVVVECLFEKVEGAEHLYPASLVELTDGKDVLE